MSEQPTSRRDPTSHEASGHRLEQQPGRDLVLTPVPPGSWPLMLGLALAGLGPLGGFLAGSMAPVAEQGGAGSPIFSAIYLYLFLGIVLGALGVVMACFGGLRLYRGRRTLEEGEAAG